MQSDVIDKIIHETMSQGWSLTTQALNLSELTAIHHYFEEHRGSFGAAKVGKGKNRIRKEEIRGDYTFWVDSLNPPPEFSPVVNFLEELKLHLNRKLLLGLKEFECHLAFYPPGTFYKTHIDKFSKDSSRIVSFVFYLHQEWKPEWGGELILYSREGETLKKVIPEPGALMIFLSDDFPHEVRPATNERRSLTGWMHTKLIN